MIRRKFLHTGTAAVTASTFGALTSAPAVHAAKVTQAPPMPKRPYGDTGEYLSIIGFPGIAVKNMEPEPARKLVQDSVDAGVNYFDVAPSYGNAESVLGPALEPHREKVFLACKSQERMAGPLLAEMEQSFKLLRTDYFDLYQLHALQSAEDIQQIFGPDGAMEALTKARQQGKIRYIGFSSHSVESAMAALKYFEFNSVLFPVNYITWYNGNFGPQVVEYARQRGAAVLALKAMARTRIQKGEERSYPNCWYHPLPDESEISDGLRFTLSQPVTAAVVSGDASLFRLALKLAPALLPLSNNELHALERKAHGVAPIFTYPSDRFDVRKMKG
jgi:aryl-alcohol dehydrogenase-like predicted oxidoreductase